MIALEYATLHTAWRCHGNTLLSTCCLVRTAFTRACAGLHADNKPSAHLNSICSHILHSGATTHQAHCRGAQQKYMHNKSMAVRHHLPTQEIDLHSDATSACSLCLRNCPLLRLQLFPFLPQTAINRIGLLPYSSSITVACLPAAC